jgi:starch synthase
VLGAKFMNLLLVGLELSPISVRSGAAESLLALSKSLRLLDHEVTIVIPYFESVSSSGLLAARRISPLPCKAGSARVYESTLPSGAKLVLLEVGGEPYAQDAFTREGSERTTLEFAEAVVRLVLERLNQGQGPDLVHAIGDRAGLVLPLLRFEDAAIGRAVSLLLPYEPGELSAELLAEWKLEAEPQKDSRSRLACVLGAAETVICPSRFVRDAFLGPLGPRSSVLRLEERGLVHIVPEGLDVGVYNPASDPALPFRYTPHDRSGKARSRSKYIQEHRLTQGAESPLVAVDLVRASSSDVKRALDEVPGLVRQGVLAVLCVRREHQAEATEAASAFADRVAVEVEPGPARARWALGAADFWLPLGGDDGSGRRLLEAARYGAVPLVESAGPLAERAVPVDAELYSGTALVYDPSESLTEAAGRAIAAYRRPAFSSWVGRVMAQDFAWDRAARRHLQLYRQMLRGGVSSRSELGAAEASAL